MLKKLQIFGFGILSSLFVSSVSFGLECPPAADFKNDVVQLPPHEFKPENGLLKFFSVASNFMIDESHENLNQDWIMILNIKAQPQQLSQNFSADLIQHMNLVTQKPLEVYLDTENNAQYCLYQSMDNPKQGAIAYHIPKGFNTRTQANVMNFVRSMSIK